TGHARHSNVLLPVMRSTSDSRGSPGCPISGPPFPFEPSLPRVVPVRLGKGWTAVVREANSVLVESPRLRPLWWLAAAVAVIRIGLLGAFMMDARFDFGALPGDSFYRSHSCLTAYWRAAE